ncbi:UDP-N-acetylmuramoylalanine--D-glutamate ligase [Candidatus Collierbacteria bacterium RIFOXYA2_FULL_46_10]|uniref:UDP-N-acetylmuramoylalanine--D-glutamate ligase n=1 Tax=Candidatus Collierbacteria bacterium RIFOXYA2_FULL_46_10 TaxID=1817726 RepID=A0A1F5F5W8_9BACT|nr:MAG: UDP-N-acetylmuramoylalanine--D-glutamate ligase [Candidatus Collierbacteria bacterium RIFOXYA2_FULL_46_10]
MNIQTYFQGKKILVFGLGQQGGGIGDANYLARHGHQVKVADLLTAKDLKLDSSTLSPEISQSLGGHLPTDIHWADIILKNPGVPDDQPLIKLARSLGKDVVTSIALYVKYAPHPVIGITGTRGKSTTTALISALLNKAYPHQIITGGNIPGTSGLALFDESTDQRYSVLELSSFQLHNFHDLHLSPHIAVITNLYPDHLNRYSSLEAYQQDKSAICAYQQSKDFTLVNAKNPGALAISQASPGQITSYQASDVTGWETSLPGTHNRENLAAMAALARVLQLPPDLARLVAQTFAGLPFRQELIATVKGVRYINDTTATTPVALAKAVEAQTTPFILLVGGESKNLPTQPILDSLKNNDLVKSIIILGSHHLPAFVEELRTLCGSKIIGQVDSMPEAVKLAAKVATSGDTVLLSPGFASFDLFANEFDRGRQFNQAVTSLNYA